MQIIKRILIAVFFIGSLNAQLNEVKLILPKEIGSSYYEFAKFFPDEKHFATCTNALTIYNTETAEIIDEVDIPFNSKSLTINAEGKLLAYCVNNTIEIYRYENQKLNFFKRINSSTFLANLPNGQVYGSLPISNCFFTKEINLLYVSVGGFTLLLNINDEKVITSNVFPVTDYIMACAYNLKENVIYLAKSSGTIQSIFKQSVKDLSDVKELISTPTNIAKIKSKDSLLICFTSASYFILNCNTNKVIHEVKIPTYNYTYLDKDTKALANKRPTIIKPDTVNFKNNEYIYDIDFLTGTNYCLYSTTKGIKWINLKSSKLFQTTTSQGTGIVISPTGNRLITTVYYPFKAIKIIEPKNNFKFIAERPALSGNINNAEISPANKWLFLNSGTSGFLWDLSNYTKYTVIKDPSGNDTSFIYSVKFLNDSELVVNSGRDFEHLNLTIYNIPKKKYTIQLKKNVYAFFSGFLNNEFYYSDYNSLTIVNLKTGVSETYKGLYSLLASNPSQLVAYNNDLVFVPKQNGYSFVNRKTKEAIYESDAWATNAKVIISDDQKSIFTSAQIKKKMNISGADIEMDVFAIVKIDVASKKIVTNYAISYYPYNFVIKNSKIGIWYLDYNLNGDGIQRTKYDEFDIESGQLLNSKVIAETNNVLPFHSAAETGNYFALSSSEGDFFKIFNQQGEEIIDLKDLKIFMPKCYFLENQKKAIILNTNNSLLTFVDLEKKKVIGQLANAIFDNYFLLTTELFYLGSKEFVKNLRFKYNSEVYSFEQFDAYLNQPHKVLKAFGCVDTILINSYESAYKKRLKLLGLNTQSKMSFSNIPKISKVIIQEDKAGSVSISITANKGNNALKELVVLNNGVTLFQEQVKESNKEFIISNLKVELTSGINRIEVFARDINGLESTKTTRFYNNTVDAKPNLYLLVMASEKFENTKFDLTYAVKDADDIAKNFSNSKSFEKVYLKKLFNKSFTTDSVLQLKQYFSKATTNDVVMVFFAGHGYLDTDFNYYFPTYYTNFTDPKINSVAFNLFDDLFKNIKPSRKLMFIDACFSGEVDIDTKSSPIDNSTNEKEKQKNRSLMAGKQLLTQSSALEMSKVVFSDLRQNSEATIISSAGGNEAAFEGEDWNNGLFTYCVLNGLKNLKADKNSDGLITLSELQSFVSEQVNKLSDGAQTPTYRMENNAIDYELWRK